MDLSEPVTNALGKSRSTPTRSASSKSIGPTCRDSGTSAPSTPSPFPTPTCGAEDSRASLSPSPASEALQMTSAIFGLRGSLSSPVAVLDGSSVRTSQDSFLPREEKHGGVSSVTWPRSGTLRNGRCYPLETSALRIVGRGFGSSQRWPTPDANAKERTNRSDSPGAAIRPTLALAVKWPTATVGDSKNAANATSGRKPGSKHHAGTTLVDAIRTWPKARVHMTRGTREDRGRCNLEEVVHSQADARSAGAAPASPGAAIPQTRLWPTPHGIGGDDGHGSELSQAARAGRPGKHRVWSTPNASEFPFETMDEWRERNAKKKAENPKLGEVQLSLQTQVGGQLNPSWVEWLMNYPIGWTELT